MESTAYKFHVRFGKDGKPRIQLVGATPDGSIFRTGFATLEKEAVKAWVENSVEAMEEMSRKRAKKLAERPAQSKKLDAGE